MIKNLKFYIVVWIYGLYLSIIIPLGILGSLLLFTGLILLAQLAKLVDTVIISIKKLRRK